MRSVLWLPLVFAACLQAPAATVGIYFDPFGRQQSLVVPANRAFDFYVVVRDIPDGMLAFEICVVVPDGLTVLDSELHPRVAHNPPGQSCPTPTMDSCVDVGSDLWLLRFVATYDRGPARPDALICVWALPNSPFPNLGSYLNCAREDQPLYFAQVGDGHYPNGCAVLNPTRPIRLDADKRSWAMLKALYD